LEWGRGNGDEVGYSSQFKLFGLLKRRISYAALPYLIFSYLKGAVFIDAGNVWLLKEDRQLGGAFQWKQFYKEIAIGTGFGMRLDFDYFVIRLDSAFAIRKPYQEEGFQWTFNRLAFLDKDWRKGNVVWNLGIGYPF